MKIVIDDKIPYIKGAFEPFAEVVYLPGAKTTPNDVQDADAIVTRTRTICNEKLLKDSKVSFIATATIGFDHIDTDFCKKSGIEWTNAPGCNSGSVAQYLSSALFSYAEKEKILLQGKTIGIVGVGNVGKKVERLCKLFGMKVLLNDPPRERVEGSEHFVNLETIWKESDFITFHTPLIKEGTDKTWHLFNDNVLQKLRKKPVIINSSRGEVTSTESLIKAKKEGFISGLIIDCWENEPHINLELLDLCQYATPHIAGYSKDGKANGTEMSVQSISKFFKLSLNNWKANGLPLPDKPNISLETNPSSEQQISHSILHTYRIEKDSEKLKNGHILFEKLRGDYPVRREFHAYSVERSCLNENQIELFCKIGFNISQ